jgi:hypothetical protein
VQVGRSLGSKRAVSVVAINRLDARKSSVISRIGAAAVRARQWRSDTVARHAAVDTPIGLAAVEAAAPA